MRATTTATYRPCENCGEVAWTDRWCDSCRFDQGEHIDARVAPIGASPASSNTQEISGVLMRPYMPGDDLLLDVDGTRTFFPASRVYDVAPYAPRTGGFR